MNDFRVKVSIILPAYNRGGLLAGAVESLLGQTYRDFEVIIINDGSTDDTAEVISKVSDPRVRCITFRENRGAAAARNEGIREARGEFIAFQDSDDIWLPDKLRRQMKEFEELDGNCGVVYSGIWRVKDGGQYYVPEGRVNREGDIHGDLLRGNFVALPSAVVRKECFERSGMFDEALPCLQDWELWIRISKKYRFRFMNLGTVKAYYSEDSISVSPEKLVTAWERILSVHRYDFERNKRAMAKRLVHLGHYCCLLGRVGKGRGYLLEALKTFPCNPAGIFLLVLSFSGNKLYAFLFSAGGRTGK